MDEVADSHYRAKVNKQFDEREAAEQEALGASRKP
jgi:hypothetical protein